MKKHLKSITGIDSQKNFDRCVGIVLLISGLFGFCLSAFVYPSVQYSVEYGQVLSGVVKYPPGIPEGLIKTHLWALPNQLSALGLMAGFSEGFLSIVISGLHGMLSLQALGLLLFAINGRVWISSFTPALFLFSGVTAFGQVYPVLLMGFFATHGALGLSYVLFLLAVFGVRWNRFGAVLLGMAPALHVVLGGLMWVIVPVGWVVKNKKWIKEIRALSIWFLAGVLITLVSFCIHFLRLPPMPEVSSVEVKRLFIHFIQIWDLHRVPVDFSSYEFFLNLMGLTVCGVSLHKCGSSMPERVQLVLRILMITGILALAFALITHLPVSWVPAVLIRAMPARLLNVFVISYPAIVLGMLTREGTKKEAQFFATLMITLLFLPCVSRFFRDLVTPLFKFFTLITGGVIVIMTASYSSTISKKNKFYTLQITLAKYLQVIMVVALAAFLVTELKLAAFRRLFAKEARKKTAGSSVLLTSSAIKGVQYYLRRPVLLDVSKLDNLCYMPELLPVAASILNDVYGIDFFNPPYEARHTGAISPYGEERKLWESWSLEEWRNVSKKYHVGGVVVPSGWRLAVPVEYRLKKSTIYHIPMQE